jgi:hypothetical protein
MAARDRYSRKLECVRCASEGYAEVSEDDTPTRRHPDFTIDSLPAGFTTERPSKYPEKHLIRCRCGHVFAFKQKSVYAAGGEPRH